MSTTPAETGLPDRFSSDVRSTVAVVGSTPELPRAVRVPVSSVSFPASVVRRKSSVRIVFPHSVGGVPPFRTYEVRVLHGSETDLFRTQAVLTDAGDSRRLSGIEESPSSL